jgi:hypothetical protein
MTKESALVEVQLASQVRSVKKSKDSRSRIFRRKSSRDNDLGKLNNGMNDEDTQQPPPLLRRRSSKSSKRALVDIRTRESGHLDAGRMFLHSKCEDLATPRPPDHTGVFNDLHSPRSNKQKVRNKMRTFMDLSRNRERRRMIDLIMAGTSVFCFSIAAPAEQHLWLNQNVPDEHVDGMKSMIFLSSCALASGVVCQTYLSVEEDRLRNRILPEVTLWTSGRLVSTFLQAAFNFLHAPPGTHIDYKYRIGNIYMDIFAFYTLDSFACICILFKLYHCLPPIIDYLKVDSTSGRVYGAANGVSLDGWFTTKGYVHSHPMVFITISSVVLCSMMTYIMWIFERGYCAPWAPQWSESAEIMARCSPNELERVPSFRDSFWYMFNMFAGLGNATAPLTLMGRVTAIVALVIGLVLLALILQAVTDTMSFTPSETITHVIMKRAHHRLRLYSKAAELIEATWLRHKAKQQLEKAFERRGGARTQSKAAKALVNTVQVSTLLTLYSRCCTHAVLTLLYSHCCTHAVLTLHSRTFMVH